MQSIKNSKGVKKRVTDKDVREQVYKAVGLRRGPKDGSGPNKNCKKKK